MNTKNKKGLSPVIATVLLVVLVLVLAVIVFLWARSSITEQVEKFGKPIERNCDNVDFSIDYASGLLDVSNNGNIPINSFEAKEFKNGNSVIKTIEKPVNEGKIVTIGLIDFSSGGLDSGADEIIIYPVLLGKVRNSNENKRYTCLDKGIRLTL